MQERLSLNLGWLFKPSFDQGEISAPAWDTYQPITIPHTVKELSYNCFSHDETAMVSSYVRKFTVPGDIPWQASDSRVFGCHGPLPALCKRRICI